MIVVIILHVIVCIALILIVLLQKGKGADMGAAFGGSSQAVFGGAGASSFLSKITTAAAIIFMITCLLLSVLGKGGKSESIMEGAQVKIPAAQTGSATPGDTQAEEK
ncbi:MAG: preprotein translocase subunit SecG [Desulfatiglans sp.]|jgi:preprotein translocase subunit SecG|nr:preprotein translocase subunit SecG [Desulfatiglans sp.]